MATLRLTADVKAKYPQVQPDGRVAERFKAPVLKVLAQISPKRPDARQPAHQ
jgi:hypothetical protein